MHNNLHEWCLHYDRCNFNLHVNVSGPCKIYLSCCLFTTLQGSLLLFTFLFLPLKNITYLYQKNILTLLYNNYFGHSSELFKFSEMHKLS